MLTARYRDRPGCRIEAGPHAHETAHEAAAGAIWLDLLDPSEAERAAVERAFEMRVPAREEIVEIESSSRLRVEEDVLYLSTSMRARQEADGPLRPLGFVLSEARLITVRYAESAVFDEVARAAVRREGESSLNSFATLLEAMVDRIADGLERNGAELAALSHRVFHVEDAPGQPRNDKLLREMLKSIGRVGDDVSQWRDVLLGLDRIAGYVPDAASAWLPAAIVGRLGTLRRDVRSLSDYDVQMTGKVQFLLDATLGFINIEQNNGIKVLTVISLVGIPPTFIASLYGMNFKYMPELNWSFGYPYALVLMGLSVVLPLLFFWRRGWL